MAVLLPKRTNSDGFRIPDEFQNNEEPSYSITSSFYVKAASIPFLLRDNYMYIISTDGDLVDEHTTCFATIQFLICLKYFSTAKST